MINLLKFIKRLNAGTVIKYTGSLKNNGICLKEWNTKEFHHDICEFGKFNLITRKQYNANTS